MHRNIKCAACDSSQVEQLPFKVSRDFPIVVCKRCGLKFLLSSSFETLDDDEYWDDVNKHIYQTPSVLKDIRNKHAKYLQHIIDTSPPNNTLLDVGCGNGSFLVSSQQAGFESIGIEPSPIAVELCRQLYSRSPACGYLTMGSDLPKTFGVLTAWDVIEHVADPRQFLAVCNSHLQEGGVLLLETPDESSMIRKLLNIISSLSIPGLDLRPQLYYSNHRNYFTHNSMIRILQSTGFSTVSIYREHSIYSKAYEKIRLYRKYTDMQMLKYKILFGLLKLPGFSNKQIIVARKTS